MTAGALYISGAADVIVRGDDGRLLTHYVLTVYTGHAAGGELCAGDDAMDARWVPVDALDSVELVPAVAAHIADARHLLAQRSL
jgi:hypothetical protein